MQSQFLHVHSGLWHLQSAPQSQSPFLQHSQLQTFSHPQLHFTFAVSEAFAVPAEINITASANNPIANFFIFLSPFISRDFVQVPV